MKSNEGTLRLGRLPRTEFAKVTISVPVDVKAALDRYAELHSQLHGEKVDAAALIPHMLAAFIERDRGYKFMTSKSRQRNHGTVSEVVGGRIG